MRSAKRYFTYKVNSTKSPDDLSRQTSLLLKRLSLNKNLDKPNRISVDLGYVNEDFLNNKNTLRITYLYK